VGGASDIGQDRVRILSDIPGRLRFKLPNAQRSQERINGIAAVLGEADVRGVETNLQTGSVLVHYDPATTTTEELFEVLGGLGLTPVYGSGAAGAPESRPAARVVTAADQLNSRVARATSGVDLRLLVPLGLGALSARQALRDTGGLSKAPWYVLAWYSFDSFIKLNPPRLVQREAS
jgi:Heavy metal associated domain 2